MSYRRKKAAAGEDKAMSGSTITVLSVWITMVSAINIQLIPQYPVIQSSVTLSVTGITSKITTFLWFKGSDTSPDYLILTYFPNDKSPTTAGEKYFSRAQAFSNGSLSITNLNISDGGQYIVKIQTEKSMQSSVFLKVYELVSKPVITASQSQIQESDALNLTCSAAKADRVIWKKDHASLPDDVRVSADNTTITFSRVNRTDAGEYQCEAQNIASKSTSDLYILTVSYASECSTCDTNIAAISGVACAVALIIAVLVTICVLLYKHCVHPVLEIIDSPYEREDPCAIYDNVLELAPVSNIQIHSNFIYDNVLELEPAQISKEEPAYMVLQYVSESPYNELNR